MNKLEEYRDERAKLSFNSKTAPHFTMGFDAAIALELPVKFHIWTQEQEAKEEPIYLTDDDRWYTPEYTGLPKHVTTKQLYQYWIENVFNI